MDIGSIYSCFLKVEVMVFDFEAFKSIQFCAQNQLLPEVDCSLGRDTVAVWLVVIGNHSLYRMVNSRIVGILDIIGIWC